MKLYKITIRKSYLAEDSYTAYIETQRNFSRMGDLIPVLNKFIKTSSYRRQFFIECRSAIIHRECEPLKAVPAYVHLNESLFLKIEKITTIKV